VIRPTRWAPTGGCLLKDGDVTFAEFTDLLDSVLSPTVVGHPAWRFEPSFVSIEEPHQTVRVANHGGRGHTFTEGGVRRRIRSVAAAARLVLA
jgi:hypothetical protein